MTPCVISTKQNHIMQKKVFFFFLSRIRDKKDETPFSKNIMVTTETTLVIQSSDL